VQVSTVSDLSALILDSVGHLDSSLSLLGLDPARAYYWRVNAANSGGTGPWSPIRGFTTLPLAPNTPSLVSPAQGAGSVPVSPTLVWSPVSGAVSYQVQLSTASNFSALVLDSAGLADTSLAISGLEQGRTYYWRVNAVNSGGTGPWSATRNFTVTAPVSLSPEPRQFRFFAGDGMLQYALPEAARVSIRLYSMEGRLAYAYSGHQPAGTHQQSLGNGTLSPGVYRLRFQAGGFSREKSLAIPFR
jgi:hypothetical protein